MSRPGPGHLRAAAGRPARGFLEARYSWGLTKVIKEDLEGGSFKNRGFLVLVGVTFRVGG